MKILILVLLCFTSTAALAHESADHASTSEQARDPTVTATSRPLHPALRVLRELGGGTLLGAGVGAAGFIAGFGIGLGLIGGQTSGAGFAAAIPVIFGAVGGGVLFPLGWIAGVRWGGDAYGSLGGAALGLLGGGLLGLLAWNVPEVGPGLAVALPLVGSLFGYELSRQFGPFAEGRLAVAPLAFRGGGGAQLAVLF